MRRRVQASGRGRNERENQIGHRRLSEPRSETRENGTWRWRSIALLAGGLSLLSDVIIVVSLDLTPAALRDVPTIAVALIAFLLIVVMKIDVAKWLWELWRVAFYMPEAEHSSRRVAGGQK